VMLFEKNSWHKLYTNAVAYSDAANVLNAKIPSKCDSRYKHRRLSAAVYEALAIEHYLKALYFVRYNKEYDERGRKNHDFYTLYTALPQQIRKDIEGQFVILLEKREMIDVLEVEDRDNIKIPRDMIGTLKLWANTFMHLRLCPTIPVSINLFFFSELEMVLKEQILTVRPD
jgi:hypothetical protein